TDNHVVDWIPPDFPCSSTADCLAISSAPPTTLGGSRRRIWFIGDLDAAVRIVDMSASNSWAEFADLFRSTQALFLRAMFVSPQAMVIANFDLLDRRKPQERTKRFLRAE